MSPENAKKAIPSFGVCPFCRQAQERVSAEGDPYRAAADDCCAERALWLLGTLTQYVANAKARNKPHDEDLDPDIRRLGAALRRLAPDPERFERAKRAVLEHNRQGGQWFDMSRVLSWVRSAGRPV